MATTLDQEFANETERARQIVAERPESWEYLLTEELLKSKLARVRRQLNDLDQGLVHGKPIIMRGASFLEWLDQASQHSMSKQNQHDLKAITQDLPKAWGPPGQSGDPIAIKQAVEQIISFCNSIMEMYAQLCAMVESPAIVAGLQERTKLLTHNFLLNKISEHELLAHQFGKPEDINSSIPPKFSISSEIIDGISSEVESFAEGLQAAASAVNDNVEIFAKEVAAIKGAALIAYRVTKFYQRMLTLTASYLPALNVTAEEEPIFYRWAREHSTIEEFDGKAVERYPVVKQHIDYLAAIPYMVDGMPLDRLLSCFYTFRDTIGVGSDDATKLLIGRLEQNQQDSQAYYELALHSMKLYGLEFVSLLYFDTKGDSKTLFRVANHDGPYWILDILSKALALGLHDLLHTAVAKFAYAFLTGSVIEPNAKQPPSAQGMARARITYREIVSQLDGYLRQSPHDLLALQILFACYKMQNQIDRQQEIEIQIEKALQLAELQVRKEPSRAARPAESSTTQQKGLQFEEVCLRLVREMGFDAQTTAITGDGGIDIVAVSTQPVIAGRYIIQCKAWKQSIGEPMVRDLYGVVHSERANKGILITTSTFTKSALAFAKDKPLELIDGPQFYRLLQQYFPEALGKQ
jgi:HJR/Mrr/RecB family endonuclease